MKRVCLFFAMLCCTIGWSGCVKTEEAAVVKKDEPAETAPKTQMYELDEESTLQAVATSDTAVQINLTNSVPVRGIQFTLEGVSITDVHTTDRTSDFLAKFNAENGGVIMVSLSRATIAPGSGPVLEVTAKGAPLARIANVKIAK